MNRSELISQMRSERQAWNLLLLEAGEERLEEILPGGGWSLKDISAHISAYEDWLAGWLEASRRGEVYGPGVTTMDGQDERNAILYRQNRMRTTRRRAR